MKTFLSIVSVAILTVAAGTVSAAPVQLTTAQLDNVTAGARTFSAAGGLVAAGGRFGSSSNVYSSVRGTSATASASNYTYGTGGGFAISGAISAASN